jgi:uncharacterized protein (UPF0297 family)
MDLDSTMFFRAENSTDNATKEILNTVYVALQEKGYDPSRQIAGYILSEDPVYISNWQNARGVIQHIDRDDLLRELIDYYLKDIDAEAD